ALLDERMELLGHRAVRLLHRLDRCEHVLFARRPVLARALLCLQLLGASSHRGLFLGCESRGFLRASSGFRLCHSERTSCVGLRQVLQPGPQEAAQLRAAFRDRRPESPARRPSSPLTDSNRRPPPYHVGPGLQPTPSCVTEWLDTVVAALYGMVRNDRG